MQFFRNPLYKCIPEHRVSEITSRARQQHGFKTIVRKIREELVAQVIIAVVGSRVNVECLAFIPPCRSAMYAKANVLIDDFRSVYEIGHCRAAFIFDATAVVISDFTPTWI